MQIFKHMKNTEQKLAAFCPSCGELHVDEKGNIDHPELDRLYADMLQLSWKATYIPMLNDKPIMGAPLPIV